jgi:hypothetical protein
MTELEIVLMFAWLTTLWLWRKAYLAVRTLRRIIIDVGFDIARVEVDEERHIIHIIRK